jgi:UDP-glucose 4-epimerase
MSASRPILITGAAGHVGGRLFQQLAAEHPGRVRPAFRQQVELPARAKGVSPVIGDLGDDTVRRAALSEVGTVVHLATRGHSASQQPTIDNLRSELSVTCALARAAANQGVRKFVFVSSMIREVLFIMRNGNTHRILIFGVEIADVETRPCGTEGPGFSCFRV